MMADLTTVGGRENRTWLKDWDPTGKLRELLTEHWATLEVNDQLALERALNEIDREMDWYHGQNQLNKGRVRTLEAAARLRHQKFWAVVAAIERVFTRIAEAAREQRMAAITREREKHEGTAPDDR